MKKARVRLEQEVRRRTAALREREERLRAIHDNALGAIITMSPEGTIQSVNQVAKTMFGYTDEEMLGHPMGMLMSSPEREQHDGHLRLLRETGRTDIVGTIREVRARRKDGSLFDVALCVTHASEIDLFIGILLDISRRKQLEREVVEIATLEQKHIGEVLHDGCGQELTALGLLADSLVETLDPKAPESAKIAGKIGQGIRRVLQQVRGLSRGLALTDIEPTALPVALAELTSRLSDTGDIRCTFRGDSTTEVGSPVQATHLYHIAQEACTNALKHSGARHLEVGLEQKDGTLVLTVQDDGTGIADGTDEGLGHRIMRNRASVLGAELTIAPVKPHGTVVTCKIKQEHSDGPGQQ
jgi:PAS domain S-box-containing protein